MKKIYNIIISGIALVLIFSCTPQKKLSRLVKKHPELLQVTDTLKITDTIHFKTERVYRDSVFLLSAAQHDTVIVTEKNLTIRTYIKGDTVYVSGECDTVFVDKIITKKVPIKQIVNKPRSIFLELFWGLIGCFVVFFIMWLIYKALMYFKKYSRFS